MKYAIGALAFTLAIAGGCSSPPTGFDTEYPGGLIPAITEAARTRDQKAVPDIIELLDHADPAVRFAAIHALERITGQTLGYDYAAPESRRREQTAAWVRWYEEQSGRRTGDPVASR